MSNLDESSIREDASKAKTIKADGQALSELEVFEKDSQLELKQTFHVVFIWGLRVTGILGIIVIILRTWDAIAPASCIWMTTDQIQSLDKVLFSGAVGTIMGRYLGKIFPPEDRN
jgi:hypothetical protein